MLRLIRGSFMEGCGVIVWDEERDKIYHLIVHKEKKTDKLFVEISEQKFYEEDICKQ